MSLVMCLRAYLEKSYEEWGRTEQTSAAESANKSAAISAGEDRSRHRTPNVLAVGHGVFASNIAENESRRSTLTPEPVFASPPWQR